MRRRKSPPTEFTRSTDDIEAAPKLPAAAYRAGSISQQLDMNETGPLRGDEILHHHGLPDPDNRPDSDPLPLAADRMEENYRVDMSEESREGDEESGDEHSSGLQGEDQQELQYDSTGPDHSDAGLPGEMTEKAAKLDPTQRGYKRRAA